MDSSEVERLSHDPIVVGSNLARVLTLYDKSKREVPLPRIARFFATFCIETFTFKYKFFAKNKSLRRYVKTLFDAAAVGAATGAAASAVADAYASAASTA